jgi:hypothetical protein
MKFGMPPQPERRNVSISIRVRPSERALLDQATRLTGLSQAELLVHLLRQFVEQHRQDTQSADSNVLADREIASGQ